MRIGRNLQCLFVVLAIVDAVGCTSTDGPAEAQPPALSGLYRTSDPGTVAVISFDANQYRLWTNAACAKASDDGGNLDSCAEDGTYTNDDGVLTLREEGTGKTTVFPIKVLDVRPASSAAPSLTTQAVGLVGPPSRVVSPSPIVSKMDLGGQGVVLVGSFRIMGCGTDADGVIRTVIHPCSGPTPACPEGSPRAGWVPTGGSAQGHCD